MRPVVAVAEVVLGTVSEMQGVGKMVEHLQEKDTQEAELEAVLRH